MVVKILNGDCRDMLKTLPDKSIHCCVTSPPYYGLRDYGTAKWEGGDENCSHVVGNQVQDNKAPNAISAGVRHGCDASTCKLCGAKRVDKQIGLEQSPEEYVKNLVEVFREVKRVLRDDGTLWLNLGDSYAGSGKCAWDKKDLQKEVYVSDKNSPQCKLQKVPIGLKPKDLIGIPWMVAFALRADGWYLRQDIIWSKNNPMPESVKDRCTKSHEYIFLLTKSPKYFFDSDAIKEPLARPEEGSRKTPAVFGGRDKFEQAKEQSRLHSGNEYLGTSDGKRNKRSVWQINTRPYRGAHFATFPIDLVEPCIKAGTSEKGVCSVCGSPFKRITEVIGKVKQKWGTTERPDCRLGNENGNGDKGIRTGMVNIKNTVGWTPSCSCNAPSIPATVLDPFGGSGTVGQWCYLNGRNAVLIELNPEYIPLIEERINTVPKPSKKKVTECIEEDTETEEELSIEDLEKSMNPEEQDSYYNLLLGVPFEYFEMVRKAYWVEKGVV